MSLYVLCRVGLTYIVDPEKVLSYAKCYGFSDTCEFMKANGYFYGRNQSGYYVIGLECHMYETSVFRSDPLMYLSFMDRSPDLSIFQMDSIQAETFKITVAHMGGDVTVEPTMSLCTVLLNESEMISYLRDRFMSIETDMKSVNNDSSESEISNHNFKFSLLSMIMRLLNNLQTSLFNV